MAREATPVSRRLDLARELRRLRKAAGKTLDDAARALEASTPTVSRIENGLRLPQARDVRDLCLLYGAETETERLTAYLATAREHSWWEDYAGAAENLVTYVGLEEAASTVETFSGLRIPGLLQAPGYMRTYMEAVAGPHAIDSGQIDQMIEMRLERQKQLIAESPLSVAAIVDEGALHRRLADPSVMPDQFAHLLKQSQLETVDLRVVPFSAGLYPGLDGVFTILRLPGDRADTVFIEGLIGEEFRSDPDEVELYTNVMRLLRSVALDQDQTRDLLRSLA